MLAVNGADDPDGNPANLQDRVNELMVRVDGHHVCTVCEKTYKAKQSLIFHVEGTHMRLRLPCPNSGCERTFPTREAREKHVKKCHASKKAT